MNNENMIKIKYKKLTKKIMSQLEHIIKNYWNNKDTLNWEEDPEKLFTSKKGLIKQILSISDERETTLIYVAIPSIDKWKIVSVAIELR